MTDGHIDEEKLHDRVVELFAEYRRIDEVVFDLPKSAKLQQLTDIRVELSQHIETAKGLYEATLPKAHDTDDDNPHSEPLTREASFTNEDFEPSASYEFCDNLVDEKEAEIEEELPTSIFTGALMNYWQGHLLFLNQLSGIKPTPKRKSSGGNRRKHRPNQSKQNHDSNSKRSHDTPSESDTQSPRYYLEKAVKLDPTNISSWNTLGEYYNHMGDLESARCCFENALRYNASNKIAYVNLCRILRQRQYAVAQQMQQTKTSHRTQGKHGKHKIPEPPANVVNQQLRHNLSISLELATMGLKVVENGLVDGELWFNFGNAYLQSFANQNRNICGLNGENGKNVNAFRKAEQAYTRAMGAKIYSHENHPDLHFNLHVMRVFQCDFHEAFRQLNIAIQFGDEQVAAREAAKTLSQQIIQYHKTLTNHKGKAAAKLREDIKLIQRLLATITRPVVELGFNPIRIADLTQELNGGQALVLKCMNVLSYESSPFYLSCCDADGQCCIFALYMTERPFAQQILGLCDSVDGTSNDVGVLPSTGNCGQSLLIVTNPVGKRVQNIDFNSVLEGTPYASSRFPSVDYWIVTFRDPSDLFIDGRQLHVTFD